MNRFTVSVMAAALAAVSPVAAYGVACVDSTLVAVFDYINACRTEVSDAGCAAYVDYVALEAADSSTWTLQNNYDST